MRTGRLRIRVHAVWAVKRPSDIYTLDAAHLPRVATFPQNLCGRPAHTLDRVTGPPPTAQEHLRKMQAITSEAPAHQVFLLPNELETPRACHYMRRSPKRPRKG